MINDSLKNKGLLYITEKVKEGRATNFANTFILSAGDREYIIDSSCGRKRYKEIKSLLGKGKEYTILCTHYHNDHIANNGRLAGNSSPIIYHWNATKKVPYLRTNGTGQILRMYRDMEKRGFLKRLGFFSDSFIKLLLKRNIYSRYIAEPLLFTVSYIFSLRTIGRIHSGKKYVRYLEDSGRIKLPIEGLDAEGWKIDDGLYAIEAPGHTDCHTVYYHRKNRILIAGDSLNFLTPNDIQFGTLKETIETQKFLLALAVKEKIEILCQGHYSPVTGNEAVTRYISDIIDKHEHVYNLLKKHIRDKNPDISFDELYSSVCKIDDPVIRRLTKITFPRSTLVFLDVYLLKLLEESGKETMDC